jgi:hypothetical protein
MRVGRSSPTALGVAPHIRVRPEAADAQALAARAKFERDGLRLRGGRPRTMVPSLGTVAGIVLLVEFPEEPHTIQPGEVRNYCNQINYSDNGNHGSVRDDFFDMSYGNLTYTNFVPTSYYVARTNKVYYTDPTIPWGTRASELI